MSDFSAKLADARARGFTLDRVMRELGHGDFVKRSCKSPFREERTPSFGVWHDSAGVMKWKDFTTGESGDEIDFIAMANGFSSKEATDFYFSMAGVETPSGDRPPAPKKKKPTPAPPKPASPLRVYEPELAPFDWKACVAALTPEKIEGFAGWRGYSTEFVQWLKSQELIGMHGIYPATPVVKDGVVIGCQYRTTDGDRYVNATRGEKTPAMPLIIGKPDAQILLAMESPWDAFAFMEGLGFHKTNGNDVVCLAVTRSASNYKRLKGILEERAKSKAPGDVILVGQNDPPRKDGKPTGHDTLEKGLRELCEETGLTLKLSMPPEHVKDYNDWWREAPDIGDFIAPIEEAKTKTNSSLSNQELKIIMKSTFDDNDNFFGDRVLAEGQPATILGPGGVGKSRLVMQMAICMILGKPFLGIKTHATHKHWLFLQTENSTRRLQHDLKGIIKGLGITEKEIDVLNDHMVFHTIEHDHDCFLALNNPEEFKQVQLFITDFNPDFVVFDPLNTFTTGDLNSDADMREVCSLITKATKRGKAKRVPIVVHHSLTGKAGAQKATGWDKASYGRNSKALQAWTRSQINIAPRDPDDNTKLLITCGKNNNGAPFPDIGVYFDEEEWIYKIDEDYDPQEFQESVGNVKKSKKPKQEPAEVIRLFDDKIYGVDLIPLVREHYKCSQATAYRTLKQAIADGFISSEGDGKTTLYRKVR
ncbi:MAG TPA: AAA family ATPase [Chthoniobacteraceae bacterium]|nr:AAA family ATPase [Chthoniobacteraceae bacterium]